MWQKRHILFNTTAKGVTKMTTCLQFLDLGLIFPHLILWNGKASPSFPLLPLLSLHGWQKIPLQKELAPWGNDTQLWTNRLHPLGLPFISVRMYGAVSVKRALRACLATRSITRCEAEILLASIIFCHTDVSWPTIICHPPGLGQQ